METLYIDPENLTKNYYEAKSALSLFKEEDLPMGQIYALQCIAEKKEIKINKFPENIYKRNKDYEKHAAYWLTTEQYKGLRSDDAKKEYISFVKLVLNRKYSEVTFAWKILTDDSISPTSFITRI